MPSDSTRHADTALPEQARRRSGAFYTPRLWAAEAHALLDRHLPGWREDFLVWDPACGTKNLTRDAAFSNLITTTLDPQDLSATADLNPQALALDLDFLNQPLPPEVTARLERATDVLFLLNPPYATATNQDETHKKGVATNATNRAMAARPGYKAATQQLYTQFLFRIMEITAHYRRHHRLKRAVIGLFSNDRFLHGTASWEAFMGDFTSQFGFTDGFVLNASAFSGVATGWGISFTLWDTAQPNPLAYRLTLKDHDASDLGTKVITPTPRGETLSAWLKEATPPAPRKAEPYPRLSGALKLNTSANPRGFLTAGALGYLHNNADSVEHSAKYVGLYSSAFGSGNGISVTPANFERACAVFALRKATVPAAKDLWRTGHDVYRRPHTRTAQTPTDQALSQQSLTDQDLTDQDIIDPEFFGDCVVYALGTRSGSNQSGMPVHGITNQFCWFHSDRFAHQWLRTNPLSPQAQELLDALNQLHQDTLPFHAQHPELHLDAPDPGFRQLYLCAKAHDLPVLKTYARAHAQLHAKIRDAAYRLGMLNPPGPSTARI